MTSRRCRHVLPRMLTVLALLAAAAALALSGGCAGGKKKQDTRQSRRAVTAGPALMRHEFALPGLGGDFRVVVYCPEDAAYRAEKAAFDELATLEGVFDASRADSEVSQIHANAGLGAVRVSDTLYDVLKEGVRLTNASDGAIDVTAGAYDALWRAAAAGNVRTLSEEDLATADPLVGVDKLRLDPIDRTAHLTVAGMRLDSSALLRGFACDRILRSLSRAGFPIALVDGGGRIALGDAPPGTEGWRIEVTNAPRKSKARVLTLSRRGIASSGRAGDVVTIEGQTYSRVLNPQTGIGATNLAPATVVARRAWQADALARAAAVLGEERGRRLVASVRNARVSFHAPPAANAAPAEPRETSGEPEATSRSADPTGRPTPPGSPRR